MHQLVIKYFDNSKMHGANVKIVYPQFTDFLTQLSAARNMSQYMYGFLITIVLTAPYLLDARSWDAAMSACCLHSDSRMRHVRVCSHIT